MSLPKNILALYSGNQKELSTLKYADALALEYGSNAKCLNACPDLDAPGISNYLGEGSVGLYGKYLESVKRDLKIAQGKLKEQFELNKFKKLAWYSEIGNPVEIISYWGKFSDLIIIEKSVESLNLDFEGTIHSALFETGRPVILHPAGYEFKKIEKVILAWDGSFRVADAIKSSIGFLQTAKQVTILTIDESQKDTSNVKDLSNYLNTYNIKAEHKNISKISRNIGDEIIHEAENQKADLVVMGAFTHSRMRELVLGGVTKFILSNTTIPVMLKH